MSPAALSCEATCVMTRRRMYSEVLWAGMLTGGVGSLVAVTPLL
jgi:hypothetical protein